VRLAGGHHARQLGLAACQTVVMSQGPSSQLSQGHLAPQADLLSVAGQLSRAAVVLLLCHPVGCGTVHILKRHLNVQGLSWELANVAMLWRAGNHHGLCMYAQLGSRCMQQCGVYCWYMLLGMASKCVADQQSIDELLFNSYRRRLLVILLLSSMPTCPCTQVVWYALSNQSH
jgi:hypothetical protein